MTVLVVCKSIGLAPGAPNTVTLVSRTALLFCAACLKEDTVNYMRVRCSFRVQPSIFSAGVVQKLGQWLEEVLEGGSLFPFDIDLCRHTRLQLDVACLAQ